MVRYAIFERKTDSKGQPYLLSVGIIEARNMVEAIRKLENNFNQYVDISYGGGDIYLAPKSSFSRIGKLGTLGLGEPLPWTETGTEEKPETVEK